MSRYWYFNCKSCNVDHGFEGSAEGFNHGQDLLRTIYQVREHILAIRDQDMTGYLTVEIMAHPDASYIWEFLERHHDHDLELQSEYGDVEPLEDVKS